MQQLNNFLFGEKVIVADSGRGLWANQTTVKHFKPEQLADYFHAYKDYDLIRAPVDDLVEQAVGMGFHTVAEVDEEEKDDENNPKVRAKKVIDDFNKYFNVDDLLGNITRITLIAGFCPVETVLTKNLEKSSLMIIHPETVDPAQNKGIEWSKGQVIKLHQKVGSIENSINGDKLAWFNYGQIGNDPRGTSYVRGMIHLLNTINDATADIDRILKRYVGPQAIWKTRRSIDNIKQAVQDKQPGQDLFLGNLNPDELDNPDFPKIVEINPNVPFWQWIEYLDRRIFAYSRACNIWYFKDATVASSKEMEDIVQRHVMNIRRGLRRSMERDWYIPLLEVNGLSKDDLPKIQFGIETTGVEDLEPSMIIMKGLDYGYLDSKQFYSILRQMGISVAEREEPRQQQLPEEDEEEEKPEDIEKELEFMREMNYRNKIYDLTQMVILTSNEMKINSIIYHDLLEKYSTKHDLDTNKLKTSVDQRLAFLGFDILSEEDIVKGEIPESGFFMERLPAVRDRPENAIYDIAVLMRFHSVDNRVDKATLDDISKKYCRRYGVEDVEKVITRVSALLELEGYVIEDMAPQHVKDAIDG
jgi:hypothetical protein